MSNMITMKYNVSTNQTANFMKELYHDLPNTH